MCGIAGYIGTKKFSSSDIKKILTLMERRGPDSNGYKYIKNKADSVNLFFSRLSIIDDKKRSDQPYVYKDKVLIFNGEIYNYLEIKKILKKKGYSFHTSSDTEVLIKALDFWGEEAMKKFEGMWSFYYYDIKKNISILSRDRFGEKPLYYLKSNNSFLFGSEIKFIQQLHDKNLEINFKKIENFLKYGYKILFKENKDYFKNVFSVPPGHFIKIHKNKVEIKKYWKISFIKNFMDENETINDLKDKLFNSIQLRLRSDFPIAFLLSGGIDSNALAHISKKIFGYDVNTFSIISKDKRFDESELINTSLKSLGSKHHNLKINFKSCNFLNNLKKQTDYQDSPVTTINSFLQFLLLEKIKKKNFKVCVSGIGSDEIFSGYYDHHLLYLNEVKHNKKIYKDSLKNWNQKVFPLIQNEYLKNHKLYQKYPKFRDHIFQHSSFKETLFKTSPKIDFFEKKYLNNLMKNRMVNELCHEIVPVVLREDDHNSMYHSIENRSPYLDSNLFSSCLSMDSKFYIKNGLAKWPLRKIIENIVPDKIRLNPKKIGFNAPLKEVFDLTLKKNYDFIKKDNQIFEIVNKKMLLKIINKNKHNGVENNFLFNFISSKMFINKFNK